MKINKSKFIWSPFYLFVFVNNVVKAQIIETTNLIITTVYPRSSISGTEISIYVYGFDDEVYNNIISFISENGEKTDVVTETSINQKVLKVKVPNGLKGGNYKISINRKSDNSENIYVGLFTVLTGGGLFEEKNNTNISSTYVGDIKVEDIDGDWDYDLFSFGESGSSVLITELYLNDKNGVYENINANFKGLYAGASVIADFDNDGDVDILYNGRDRNLNEFTMLYSQVSPNEFSLIETNLTDMDNSAISVADTDSDGDQDLILTGWGGDNNERFAKYYINTGINNFDSQFNRVITPVHFSASVFGDIDSDGDLDLIIAGITKEGSRLSKIYLNDGTGKFELSNQAIVGVRRGRTVFVDVDNDLDLDLFISGEISSSSQISMLYLNDGNGNFIESNESFTYVRNGSASFGDIDADGDADLFLTGITSDSLISELYLNDGFGKFEKSEQSFIGTGFSSSELFDMDGDGDLDLIYKGGSDDYNQPPIFKCYINNSFNNTSNDVINHVNEYGLSQNYPNPFNPTTTIKYSIKDASQVTLSVHNMLGQKVATLVNEYQSPGRYKAVFNALGISSGMYLYKLTSGTYQETKKMLLLK